MDNSINTDIYIIGGIPNYDIIFNVLSLLAKNASAENIHELGGVQGRTESRTILWQKAAAFSSFFAFHDIGRTSLRPCRRIPPADVGGILLKVLLIGKAHNIKNYLIVALSLAKALWAAFISGCTIGDGVSKGCVAICIMSNSLTLSPI